MLETLSTTEAKELLQLCKTGRLFDVQRWIACGKLLSVPVNVKTAPLEIALDTGFHSLVELLARHEANQNVKNQALNHAVLLKRLDFIELLVSFGAEINSVPFVRVLRVWDPLIIRYFLDHSADFITGSPFAIAFGERIRTALRPWKECKERHPHLAQQLQEQADRALRHFCIKGDLKWVSLLMWAGADPRSSGLTLSDDEDPEDPENRATAIDSAAYCESLHVLKRLKPDPEKDDLDKLLVYAATFAHLDVVRYLLELGAKVNNKSNGGSTAFDRCLENFRFESSSGGISFGWYQPSFKASKYSVSKTRDTIEFLLEHGALWRPDNVREVDLVRRSLYDCDPDVTLELAERLLKHAACSEDTLRNLLRTPTMKKHLAPVAQKLRRIGFDVRTAEQKIEDEKQKEAFREWALRALLSRYNREKLYDEIWSEPIQHVAKRYNISDVGLAKVCKKLRIPRPGRGYWAMKAAGKSVRRRPALPDLKV